MSISITKDKLKKLINKNTLINKNNMFKRLIELCKTIKQKLSDYFYHLKTQNITKNNNEKNINMLFNIFKKIYETREKFVVKRIKNPFKSVNSNYNPWRDKNYMLKFIRNLDKEEFKFMDSLLTENFNTEDFNILYDFFTNTKSDKIYEALSSIEIDDDITFLSPKINQNKYIKIPNDNDSYLQKMYFIELCINIFPQELNNTTRTIQIKFLKKILSNKTWDIFVKIMAEPTPPKDIIYYDEIILAIGLGTICKYNFNKFRDTIAQKIIEEKNKNITTTNENIQKANDIVDLFEIYYCIGKIDKLLGLETTTEKKSLSPLSALSTSVSPSRRIGAKKDYDDILLSIIETINFLFDNNSNKYNKTDITNLKNNIIIINDEINNGLNVFIINETEFRGKELNENINILNKKIIKINEKIKSLFSFDILPEINLPSSMYDTN